MAGNNNGRYRPYEVIFYGSFDDLLELLKRYKERIAHFAFIYHDKDIYEEDNEELGHKKGELKKPHFHLLLDFYNGHTFTSVKRMFTTQDDKPRVERISDRQAKFEYLTHNNYPEKYQYSEDEIYSNNIEYYKNICKRGDRRDNDNLAMQIVEDLLKGTSPYIMLSRYGRDYVIHKAQYNDMKFDIEQWRKVHRDDNLVLTEINDTEEAPF